MKFISTCGDASCSIDDAPALGNVGYAHVIHSPLSNPDLTLANAGGKGTNLSALIRGGFPVPGGFVVTTAGYDAFVAANDLAAPITALVNTIKG